MPLDPVIAKALAQSLLGMPATDLTDSAGQDAAEDAQDDAAAEGYAPTQLSDHSLGHAMAVLNSGNMPVPPSQREPVQQVTPPPQQTKSAPPPQQAPQVDTRQLAQAGALGASAQGDALTQEQKQQRDDAQEILRRDQLADYMENPPQLAVDQQAGQQAQKLGDDMAAQAMIDRGKFEQAAQEEKKAAHLKAQEMQDEEKTNAPIVDAYAKTMHSRYEQLDQAAQEARAQQQIAIANYQKTQDEMRKMVLENPHDLFGQAGMNKMLGTISIVLGGFGSGLGGGQNQGLQIIQASANQNIMAQQRRYEQLRVLGEGDKSLFGMIQSRLQDTMATSKALENLALETYKAQLQTTANQYAPQKAQAFVADEVAKIDQAQAKNNAEVDAHFNAVASQQLRVLGRQQAAATVQQAAAMKQWQAHREQSLSGFIGWVPQKEHQKYANIVGGARDMVAIGDEMKQLLQAGWSMEDIREATINDARFFRAAKAWIDTGTRIEEGEQRTIDAFKSNNMERFFTALFGTNVNKLQEKITASQAGITHSTIKYVTTAAPNTIVFDNRDSLWGRFDPHSYKSYAQQQLKKVRGTEAGQKTLRDAQPYTPAYGD